MAGHSSKMIRIGIRTQEEFIKGLFTIATLEKSMPRCQTCVTMENVVTSQVCHSDRGSAIYDCLVLVSLLGGGSGNVNVSTSSTCISRDIVVG